MKLFTIFFRITVSIISVIFIFSFINYSYVDEEVTKIIRQFTKFHTQYPQQKIYLHTDKDKYISGETIWLKAYLMDMASQLSDTASKEIYIDLIDCSQKVTRTIMVKNNKGFASGEILLSDSILEGNYLLRAYTNWMRNFNNDFFFSKTIVIKNPNYENIITSKSLQAIKDDNESLKKSEKQISLSFFPEGGSMICGLLNNIAFKIENNLGYGIDVNGSITDDKGSKIVDLKSVHQGMGTFEFTPQVGKNYVAQISIDGKNKKFNLPKALDKGVLFKVDGSEKDIIRIFIQSNREPSATASNDVIILGQSHGKILYMSKGVVNKPIKSSISKKLFPTGIAQFTIFDGNGEPLCERLIFINSQIQTKIDLTSETSDDDISYHLKISTPAGLSKKGNLSIAVTEQLPNQTNMPWQSNILSNLLLTSDLKGKVENPLYYFNPANTDAFQKLDLVMLTHGWRRFAWKEILANNFPNLSFSSFEGMGISVSQETNSALFFPTIKNEVFDKEKIKNNTKQDRITNKVSGPNISANYFYVGEKAKGYGSILELMKGSLPGVSVSANGITIIGMSSFRSTEPLIMEDAMPTSFTSLSQIKANDIESIEVLKGADATVYGVRGMYGVIILHTRKGNPKEDTPIAQSQKTSALKFQIAREFYVPQTASWNYKPMDFNIPRTVYWKPTIITDSTGVATVTFKNKTDVEKYSINIEGMTSTGEIIHYYQ